jgi:hypothetical protein
LSNSGKMVRKRDAFGSSSDQKCPKFKGILKIWYLRYKFELWLNFWIISWALNFCGLKRNSMKFKFDEKNGKFVETCGRASNVLTKRIWAIIWLTIETKPSIYRYYEIMKFASNKIFEKNSNCFIDLYFS